VELCAEVSTFISCINAQEEIVPKIKVSLYKTHTEKNQLPHKYLLQDLEEEAVKLRTMKRPITKQAQMILQAFSVSWTTIQLHLGMVACSASHCIVSLQHLVEFMHDRRNGLELDDLTSSSVSPVVS